MDHLAHEQTLKTWIGNSTGNADKKLTRKQRKTLEHTEQKRKSNTSKNDYSGKHYYYYYYYYYSSPCEVLTPALAGVFSLEFERHNSP